jgi:replicative DNA helicase
MSQPITSYKRKELQSMEAEQALLGLLITHNDKIEEVIDTLRPFHFYHKTHQKIYQTIMHLADLNKEFSPITLPQYMNESDLAEAGGVNYFIDLHECFVSSGGAPDYAEIIVDYFLRRKIESISDDSLAHIYSMDISHRGKDCLEAMEKKIFDLSEASTHCQAFFFDYVSSQFINDLADSIKNDNPNQGISTGFLDLDKLLGGFYPTDLIILGGRPSMGKTSLGLNIAMNASKAMMANQNHGCPVAVFSLEMSKEQLIKRVLSGDTGVSSDMIRKGTLSLNDFTLLTKAKNDYQNLPLIVSDHPGMTISSLRTQARILKRKNNIGLIVVDYLQLLESGKGFSSPVQEVSAITKGLKSIAKELNIPVLALSQLSRATEKRDEKRPQLSDLRESGSIEQDADVVMFVFREEYYEARREPAQGTSQHIEWERRMDTLYNKAEIIVAKNRHGAVGTAKLFFDGKLTRFGNLSSLSGMP